MQLTYKYKLKPTKHQAVTIATNLELCRRQDNYKDSRLRRERLSQKQRLGIFP